MSYNQEEALEKVSQRFTREHNEKYNNALDALILSGPYSWRETFTPGDYAAGLVAVKNRRGEE